MGETAFNLLHSTCTAPHHGVRDGAQRGGLAAREHPAEGERTGHVRDVVALRLRLQARGRHLDRGGRRGGPQLGLPIFTTLFCSQNTS
jgi:hypothetical protein